MYTPRKVYVCTRCGHETPVLPYAADCPKCPGKMHAALVCECGQWAWASLPKGADQPEYRCVYGHVGGRIFHE